jgi:gas vesicle protein
MTTQDDDVNMKKECGGLSGFIWLIAGIGIGAVAAILLAPQSGEDTRGWISTKCKAGIDNVNTKVRQTGQQVGDWIDQGQHKVGTAVSAGRDAFEKARAGKS